MGSSEVIRLGNMVGSQACVPRFGPEVESKGWVPWFCSRVGLNVLVPWFGFMAWSQGLAQGLVPRHGPKAWLGLKTKA